MSYGTFDPVNEKYGYARVSRADQALAGQTEALRAAGCTRIWTDTASGATTSRPELDDLMSHLRAGDVLTVWRFDRIGRSLPHLLQVVDDLQARGVEFVSLNEKIDTTSTSGKLVFTIFGAIAEFERNLIRERTQLGLAAAREQGRTGGRPPKMTPAKIRQARRMRGDGVTMTEIAEVLGVGRATLYRYITV